MYCQRLFCSLLLCCTTQPKPLARCLMPPQQYVVVQKRAATQTALRLIFLEHWKILPATTDGGTHPCSTSVAYNSACVVRDSTVLKSAYLHTTPAHTHFHQQRWQPPNKAIHRRRQAKMAMSSWSVRSSSRPRPLTTSPVLPLAAW